MTIIKKRIVSILVAAAAVASVGASTIYAVPLAADTGLNVVASAANGVSYLNDLGQSKTVTSYTTIKAGTTKLTAGWYVVSGTVTVNSRMRVSGDVNIILKDGAKLIAKGGIAVNSGCEVNIFGQTAGTGSLYAGTTNGSTATAEVGYCGFGGKDTVINIAGGKIYAIGGGTANGLYAGTINLSWENAASSVYASSYKGTVYFGDVFADKQTGTVYGPGKVTGSNISKNITLSPAIIVDSRTTYMEDAAYIVKSSVTVNDRITAVGDVDIILSKNGLLKAKEGITVNRGSSLNIWGAGKLYSGTTTGSNVTAINGASGIGSDGTDKAGSITINSGTVYAIGGKDGAGIGGDAASIEIKGGTVRAQGGRNASGIGNTAGDSGCYISITGGITEALGGSAGAGIGSANSASASKITLGYTDKSDYIYASSFSGSITFLQNMYRDDTGEMARSSNMDGVKIVPTAKTTYTVTFQTNGGTYVAPQTVAAGKNASRPKDPTKSGYKFGGWYTDKYFTYSYNFNTAVNNNITLYANWIKESYTIQFNTNGGNYLYPMYVSEGDYMSTPETPYKSGYSFGGWYTDKALTKPFDYRTTRIYKDYTLYAKWVSATYTISFNSMGGSKVSSMKVEEGDSPAQRDMPFPTRAGYKFDGWYWDSDCYNRYETTAIYSNFTLYAGWTPDTTTYTISFNSMGGSKVSSMKVEEGDSPAQRDMPFPTRSGYTFDGWYWDSDCYNRYDTTAIYSNITLYAGWTPVTKTYTISFNSMGGSRVSSMNVEEGDSPAQRDMPFPTRSGYTFDGWYWDSDCYDRYDATAIYSNITLYAGWTSVTKTYTISFNSMGGSRVSSMNVEEGDSPAQRDMPFPTRSGYTFDGWYWDSDCYNKYDTTAIYSNITLYAGWIKMVTNHTVRLDSRGGSGVSNITISDGDYLNRQSLPTPSRGGYKFTGWYEDSGCNYEFSGEYVYSDTTLYAGWEEDAPITHSISFNTLGGNYISPITVADKQSVSEYSLPTPYREGYDFTGWYLDQMTNRPFNSNMGITSDITLYAGWVSSSGGFDPFAPEYGSTFSNAGLIAGIAGGAVAVGGAAAAIIIRKKKKSSKPGDTDKNEDNDKNS